MHGKGMIHRDITVRNMLILSYDPPQAAITDFGKAIQNPYSNQTGIGPGNSLAPEVWAKDGKSYDNVIDVWAYGIAVAWILGCRAQYTGNDHTITKEIHVSILEKLDDRARKYDEEADLIDMIKLMLTWDSHQRITAKLALSHRCWDGIEVQDVKRNAEVAGLDEHQMRHLVSTRRSADNGPIASTQVNGSQTLELLQRQR